MANIYSLDGKVKGSIELPEVFSVEHRPDVIQRAVVALQAGRRETYATYPIAGLQTSASYQGRRQSFRQTINKGMSRLPREKPGGGGLGRVRRVPQSMGGRRAHPPKGKDWFKKINRREYMLALKSAISATVDRALVKERGHLIDNVVGIPLIVEDKFEQLERTKDVLSSLESLGLSEDLERAREKNLRAGRGKMRGRKYKRKKSLLIVVNKDSGIKAGADNIPGVDVAEVSELDVELLAPGTHSGRLTLWTESAIKNIHRIEDGSIQGVVVSADG
ncbi:MAG: 50S ribosomal protein L4 [Candidatus Altiarchaeota archaeon]|nr:50S ribosomal protein L4 [Candidatus Altiarchaeota archaeon]